MTRIRFIPWGRYVNIKTGSRFSPAPIRRQRPFWRIARRLDYHMPGVDGLSAVSRIRKRLSKTPILVLTGDEKASVMERFIAAGADDYALKPIRALDLISRINAHLQFHQKSKFFTDYEKNIAPNTLKIIENFLKAQPDFVSIDQIVDGTQLKKKTAYRYLQYLIDKNRIETRTVYGGKGRPSVRHKWRT